MSDSKVGHCLPLYLKNKLLLAGLEDDDAPPMDLDEDQKVLTQFRERASDQAVALLEDLYVTLLGGAGGPIPYRSERRARRSTVREHWYVGGRLYRKYEKNARAYWSISLGSLRDKGPAVTLVLGPWEGESQAVFDELSAQVGETLNLESANPRNCFTHKAGFESGVIASFAPFAAETTYRELSKAIKERADIFFGKFRHQFEAALDS